MHLLTRDAMAVHLRKLKPNHRSDAPVVSSPRACNHRCRHRRCERRDYARGGDVQEDASKQKWITTTAEVTRKDPDCKLEVLAGLHRLSGSISSGYRDPPALMSTPGRWNQFGKRAFTVQA
jgi:hypothetical protein